MKKVNLALIGATGLVGATVLQVLSERKLPINNFYAYSSEKSAGSLVSLGGDLHKVMELTEENLDRDINIAIFCTGAEISEKFVPLLTRKGCAVIDNSSHYRMDKTVPLVVAEVNPEDVKWHKGIIANPNCSTIQAVVALNPLKNKYGLKRVVYSTYQSVSGAGSAGIEDLKNGSNHTFPQGISHNLIPQIDDFLDSGYTKEEMKMINETKKILHQEDLKVTATTVRVPVFCSHCESINIELEKSFDIDEVKAVLESSPGIIVKDDIEKGRYPTPRDTAGSDSVYLGRIRRDESLENGLNIWCVADNLRKGAATNAVQTLELLINSDRQAGGIE